MDKRSYRHHYHPTTGRICRCPWGHDPEHLGSVTKVAAKIDWLRDRPDMQTEEGQKFLKMMDEYWLGALNEHGDKMLPWLAREWKKKRLVPGAYSPHRFFYHKEGEPHELTESEWGNSIEPASVNRAHKTLNHHTLNEMGYLVEEMGKRGKGVDVMQHKVHELVPKLEEFRDWMKEQDRSKYGEVLHEFDDGWSVRRLQDANEAKIEGDDMGHCVGQYGSHIERGDTFIASLRDARNKPHATIELSPSHWQHARYPEHELDSVMYGSQHEDHKKMVADRREKPHDWLPRIGPNSEVQQFYGKEDSPPLDEYRDRVNEWLEPHGLEAEGSGGEPWWEETYYTEGTDNPTDYIDYDRYEWAPDDYHSAVSDAEDWGQEPPYLEEGDHDWGEIARLLPFGTQRAFYNQGRMHQPQQRYDPDFTDALRQRAYEHGHEYDLDNAIADRIDEWQESIDWDSLHPDKRGWDRYEAIRNDFADDPEYQLAQHVGEEVFGNYTDPIRTAVEPQAQHPNQQMLFHEPSNISWQDWQENNGQGAGMGPPLTYMHYGSAENEIEPLYVRWTHSPKGVQLSNNGEDHPALIPYHQDLAGDADQVHGYAYQIGNGWRLTDWEHRPVEDPYVVNQVVRALTGKGAAQRPGDSSWEPIEQDFDRLHYGLPVEAKTNFED